MGGSFDPPHTGHTGLLRSVMDTEICSRIIVVPAAASPFKKDTHEAEFRHRMRMAELAFSGLPGVEISNAEAALPLPSYTVRTLQYFKEKLPDSNFGLCMGSDSLLSFHKWHRYKEILKLAELLVVERPGYDFSGFDKEVLKRTRFIPHSPVEASSTDARKVLKSEGSPREISGAVADYISRHGLYKSS